MRVRSPSTTLTLTSTVSPGPKSGMSLPAGSLATCSASSSWIRFMKRLRRRCPARAQLFDCSGRRRLYDTARHLSSLGAVFVPAAQIGAPQIGATFAGQPLGFLPAKRGDFRMIAAKQNRGNAPAFPQLRPRVVRMLEQSVGKALDG